MARSTTNPGQTRDPRKVMKPIEDDEEEETNPGVDPELQQALTSLHRLQRDTTSRASNVEALLIKKKTPLP